MIGSKKNRKLVLVILVIICSIIFYKNIDIAPQKDTKIKIASASDWKPFSYINKYGKTEGILIDFWKLWAKSNDKEIEFKIVPWANTLELVKNGEADFHSGLFYNLNRSEYMDFGNSYMDIMTGIFVLEDIEALNMNDIKDMGIAVSRSNNSRFFLQRNYPEVKLNIYNSNKDIIKAVELGQVKALSIDYQSDLSNIATYYPELKDYKLLQNIYTRPLRIGVKKGNRQLLDYINLGLEKMSLTEIKDVNGKWQRININLTREKAIQYIIVISLITIGVLLGIVFFLRRRVKTNVIKLKESINTYESLIKLCPDAIVVQCEDRIVFVNEACLKILGIKNKYKLQDNNFVDLLHDDSKKRVKDMFDRVVREGNLSGILEEKIIKSDNCMIDISITSNAITHEGKPAVLSIFRDITERKKMEEEKKRQRDEEHRLLEEDLGHEKLKIELFSNISHEFRTPLNIILGSIQLINSIGNRGEEGFTYGKCKKYFNIMKQNCYRQIRLINNLIDITRIDSGFLKMNFKNVNIVEIVENITLSVADYIESKGIKIIFDTDVEEKVASCDVDNLERVILNLLSNAVKFTKQDGHIYVNMYDLEDKVKISVKDTGIGIPMEFQKNVFERFERTHELIDTNKTGSGIGLSLVRSIIEMHGGTIYINSEYTKGAEFIIEIPAKNLINIDYTNEVVYTNNCNQHKVEMVNIEFSDIYDL